MATEVCRNCGVEAPELSRLRDLAKLLRVCELARDTNEAERRALAWIGDELALILGDAPSLH